MRKVIEWFEELQEPYRSKAIFNCNNSEPFTGDTSADSLKKALISGFIWESTPEGHNYWAKVSFKINK